MSDELAIPDGLGGYGLGGLGALGLLWAIGPSVRAFGRNMGQWTDFHTANLFRLSAKVEDRKQQSDPDEDLAVHPRVAKEILDAAAWIDDDLQQEYLAGLIVNARTPGGVDDAALFYTRLVEGLTASQIRVHHAIYASYLGTRPASETGNVGFTTQEGCSWLTVSATVESWQRCASNGVETVDMMGPLSVALHGLQRAGLIKSTGFAQLGTVRERYQVVPSLLGATLYGRLMFSPAVGPNAIRWDPLALLRTQPPIYPVPVAVTYPPLVDVLVGAAT